jgi:hypothetical protein
MATFEELANKLENHPKETVIRLLYDMTKTAKEWKLRYECSRKRKSETAEKEKVQIRTDAEKELKQIKQHVTQKVHAITEPTALDKTRAKLQVAEMALKEVEDENAKLKKLLRHFQKDKRAHEDSEFENRRKAARIEEERDRMRNTRELRDMQLEDRMSKRREEIDRAEEQRKENDEINRQIADLKNAAFRNEISFEECSRQWNAIVDSKKEKAEKQRRQLEHIAETAQKTYNQLMQKNAAS